MTATRVTGPVTATRRHGDDTVALSLALGRGIASAPDAVDRVTGQWGALFDSGIVVAAVVAVVLNLVLPGRTRQDTVAAEPSAAR